MRPNDSDRSSARWMALFISVAFVAMYALQALSY